MPTNRMHRGLVAVSASAVAAIYMAGYLRTQSADASIEAAAVATAAPLAVAAAAPSTAIAAPTIVQTPAGASRLSPTPAPLAARTSPAPQRAAPPPTVSAAGGGGSSAVAAGYKDGTYTGQGSSRRGDVWVSVDVQGGKISQVTITRSTLQYPLRDIAGLPGQVVQRQSAQVDTVSRATYSSQAFRTAVAQALSRAA